MRNQPTDVEKHLWHFPPRPKVRGRKFRRQAAIGAYIIDFVSFADKLIVALDCPQHLNAEAIDQDKRRATWLASRGFRIIRFRNQELDENIQAVADAIGHVIDEVDVARSHLSPALPVEVLPSRGGSQTIMIVASSEAKADAFSFFLPVSSPLQAVLFDS